MTDDELRKLAEAALEQDKAATPGPWKEETICDTDSDDWCSAGPTHTYADDDPAIDDGDPHPGAEADAAFIAAARTREPELARAVLRLLEEVVELRCYRDAEEEDLG